MAKKKATQKTKPYVIRINEEQEQEWDQFAKEHYGGSRSSMIRAVVHNTIHNVSTESVPFDEKGLIEKINNSVTMTLQPITTDLDLIKTLLSSLIGNQLEKVTPVSQNEPPVLALEEIVYSRIYEYTETKKRIVELDEIIKYLLETCTDCLRFYEKYEREGKDFGKYQIGSIVSQVYQDLYDKTGNKVFKEGGNRYDF